MVWNQQIWSVQEIVERKKKKVPKEAAINHGKQTGSLLHLCVTMATSTKNKKAQEMKRGGVTWEVFQRFTHFPQSIPTETCFADIFHWMKEFKLTCHFMTVWTVSTFTHISFWIYWRKRKVMRAGASILNHNGSSSVVCCWYSEVLTAQLSRRNVTGAKNYDIQLQHIIQIHDTLL